MFIAEALRLTERERNWAFAPESRMNRALVSTNRYCDTGFSRLMTREGIMNNASVADDDRHHAEDDEDDEDGEDGEDGDDDDDDDHHHHG